MAVLLAAFLLPAVAGAEEVHDPGLGWGADIPETWVLLDADEARKLWTFADTRGHAFFQVMIITDASAQDASALHAVVAANMKAHAPGKSGGDEVLPPGEAFTVSGNDACIADLAWSMGEYPLRGYVLAMDGDSMDAVVIVSALESEWADYHDFLVSAMDSFYMDADGAALPGPMTQFVANDGWSGGHVADVSVAVEASQSMIEREARVLQHYTEADESVQKRAWRRFYLAVWRDGFLRLEELASAFARVFAENKVPRNEIPVKLLHWVQTFTYEEPKTLSDLRAPLDAALRRAGDCDSRVIVYMMLLEHLGFRSILMISPIHRHSVVGVDMAGEGMRFPMNGTDWLVSETTKVAPPGILDEKLQDPADWFGMDLHPAP